MSVAAMHETRGVLQTRERQARLAMAGLAVGLLAAFLLAVGIGALPISPPQLLSILLAKLGIAELGLHSDVQSAVLMSIRLPRALLAILVGGALGIAGAALQGLFRNPLADPTLIGISMGAALAAAMVIVLSGLLAAFLPAALFFFLLPVSAFAGGLAVTWLVYRIASSEGRTDVATMLLAGIALNAIAGAGIGLMIFMSDDRQLRDISFWMLGNLGGASWDRLALAAPMMLVPALGLPLLARPLNGLLLGETEALHLGFDVERAKRLIILLAALAVGAAVAMTGVIGFVGLVVPHLVRLAIGPDHRLLMPASLLLGPALLLVADTLSRIIVLPAELPIGILTSLVGGPFFLVLLMRRRDLGLW